MANIINFGGGSSELNGTAVAADVLANKTFYNTDPDTVVEGTMPNNGAVSVSAPANGSYTIPQGYHDGTGTVSGPTLNGNAVEANVLNTKTFYNNSATQLAGTMPNNGAVSNTETIASFGGTSTYTIPAGYHDGTGTSVITAPSLADLGSDAATASDILSGKKAYDSAGGEITGISTPQVLMYGGVSTAYSTTASTTLTAVVPNGVSKILLIGQHKGY